MIYTETDCTIRHEGRTYEAGGAIVTPDWIVAYLGSDGRTLTDWHGNPLGTYTITATWRIPNGWTSTHMHQVRARVDGITYTGRSAGRGAIYRGRKTAKQ